MTRHWHMPGRASARDDVGEGSVEPTMRVEINARHVSSAIAGCMQVAADTVDLELRELMNVYYGR